MNKTLLAAVLTQLIVGPETRGQQRLPIIDMHLHAYGAARAGADCIDWIGGPQGIPRFHQFLQEMLAARLGKRIMFGTDQMRWPESIGMAIEGVESAGVLTTDQKRDILYQNAARFLRLSDVEMARHHGRD